MGGRAPFPRVWRGRELPHPLRCPMDLLLFVLLALCLITFVCPLDLGTEL